MSLNCNPSQSEYPNLHRLAKSIADVPFIITWGSVSIADGSQVLFVGLLGIAIAAANLKFLRMPFAAISFFSFVIQLALFATTQVSSKANNKSIFPTSCQGCHGKFSYK